LIIGNGTGGLDIVRLDSSDQISNISSVSFNGSGADAGVLRLNAFNESVAGISSTGGAGIVENGGATASVFTTSFTSGIQTFTGVIQDGGVGALSLTKDGAGTQIISGENTFSGGTVVNNGVLLANSSGALGTGGVTVNGGSLGGTGGVIAGGVTLAGGTLAPGASIGTLTVGSVAGAGTLGIEYDSTTQSIDLLNVTGSLDVSTIGLSFSDLGGGSLSNPSYVFATYGSLLGTFSSVSSLPTGYTLDYAFGGNNIAIVAVPEPSTLALLTVAIVGGGLYRRNRNAKKAAAQS
jgi:autotransporter-associated beta strand protein